MSNYLQPSFCILTTMERKVCILRLKSWENVNFPPALQPPVCFSSFYILKISLFCYKKFGKRAGGWRLEGAWHRFPILRLKTPCFSTSLSGAPPPYPMHYPLHYTLQKGGYTL